MKYTGLALWLKTDLGILLAAAATLTPSTLLFAAQNPDSTFADSAAAGVRLAKTIVDTAVWDTASAGPCQRQKDTVCLRNLRDAFVPKIASARAYLDAGLASQDSTIWLAAAQVALSGGSKLAHAGAYDRAAAWLDELVTDLVHDSSGRLSFDTQQIRVQASFWFGVSTALSLGPIYAQLVKARSCTEQKALNDRLKDRIARAMEALNVGESVAPQVAGQMRSILLQYLSALNRDEPGINCHRSKWGLSRVSIRRS